jgi:hypothetical protein
MLFSVLKKNKSTSQPTNYSQKNEKEYYLYKKCMLLVGIEPRLIDSVSYIPNL